MPDLKDPSIEVLTFEEFASRQGSGFLDYSEPALHRQPSATQKQITANAKKIWRDGAESVAKRAQLRVEYCQLIKEGKIRSPDAIELAYKTAQGHPDNVSVQAARRILKKRFAALPKLIEQYPEIYTFIKEKELHE